ncbi:DUF3575 domain-containing protein [Marseilla massiliensis]|uniref:DUF3575 domain-containing protein n=1 Tax=Marseilla massiliensis TaxID=1841864 RepID=A0A938WP92_9BACT|nr:DUF3575 domain-containing protein [Marseilla massiliensis]MBM6672692.1 DUF3575 domain-containing protein [Marseilla massiliensis]
MSIKIKTILIIASLLTAVSTFATRQKADTTYTFRFVPQKDMFYVPLDGNDRELARLLECVRRNKDSILGGSLPLYVDGYCNSLDSEKENLRMAAIRSNRVKSELIVRGGIKEECFITKPHAKSHAADGDLVIVRLTVPAPEASAVESAGLSKAEEERLAAERAEQERKAAEERRKAEEERHAAEKAEADRPAKEQAARQAEQPQEITATSLESPSSAPYHFALRANLLRWATLTPDLGLEWRVHPSWGILVNGSWTSWSWNGKDRRYALWEVMPGVRYYTGKEKRGYLGVMFKAGEFNYKLSATGKQGDLMGGGITGGYQLRLSDALSLDFNVAVGCLHADYEKYEVIDGVRVRAGKETKNWWGPVNAGVTLVWKLF